VAWFTDRHTFLLAVVVYGLSMVYSVFLWRKGFRTHEHVNYFLLLAAFLLHTTAMDNGAFRSTVVRSQSFRGHHLHRVALALACMIVGLLPRLRYLAAFASPVVFVIGVFALMPALDPPHGPKAVFTGWVGSLHATMILLAYGAFGLASVAAIMFLTQQHDLKFNKLRAVLSLLPRFSGWKLRHRPIAAGGFCDAHDRVAGRRSTASARGRTLSEGRQGRLVHRPVAALSGLLVGAGGSRFRAALRLPVYRNLCVRAADVLGHEPAFRPA